MNSQIITTIKSKSNYKKKEFVLLLVIDSILLVSIFILFVIGAYIEQILIISAILLLIVSVTFFYLESLHKYLLLLFLLLTLFDVLKLSFFNIYIGNKFVSVNLISLILLVYFFMVYGNFVLIKKAKEDASKLEKSLFKEKFINLSKEKLLEKLSNKQYLTKEAIEALEELLNEKK